MTAPAARRDNGLLATDYVCVAHPAADLAAPLLDALRRTGIAAYVQAADVPVPLLLERPGDADPTADAADVPAGLWVDAHELDDVRTVLASVARHGGRPVADLGVVPDPRPEEVGPDTARPGGPATDQAGPSTEQGRGRNPTPSSRPYPTPVRPVLPPTGGPGRGPTGPPPDRSYDELDREEHFEPGEPEPLGSMSRTTRWALVLLGVSVLALVASGLLAGLLGGYDGLLSLLGTAGVVVGAGMLVTRLRDGRRDDGPDDGAVL